MNAPMTKSYDMAERAMANAIRALTMDAVQAANSGHPGMPMGMADVATVLFDRLITLDPGDPAWPDRFVTGFGAPALAAEPYRHFGFTAEAVVRTARNLIEE